MKSVLLLLITGIMSVSCIDEQYQNQRANTAKDGTALAKDTTPKDAEVEKINAISNSSQAEQLPEAAKQEQIEDKTNPEFSKEEVLFDAVQKGLMDKVKTIIDGGFVTDLNLRKPNDSTQRTLLIEAVVSDQISIVEYLISKGADLSLKDSAGKSALDHANELNQILTIKLLAKEPLTLPLLQELLLETCKNANPKVSDIEFVIARGLNPNFTLDGKDATPIFEAARNGSYTNVLTLINSGADVNFHIKGKTPLNGAISKQKIDIIKLLLEKNADPTIPYENRGKKYPPRDYALQLFGGKESEAENLQQILTVLDSALAAWSQK